MWIYTNALISPRPEDMEHFKSQLHSITDAINKTWDFLYGAYEWTQQYSMELQECKSMKSLQYDMEVPCIRLLWYSSRSLLGWASGVGCWVVGLRVGWFGGSTQKKWKKTKTRNGKMKKHQDTKKHEKMEKSKYTKTKKGETPRHEKMEKTTKKSAHEKTKTEKSRHEKMKKNEKSTDEKKLKKKGRPEKN